jgi:hypothetical protein
VVDLLMQRQRFTLELANALEQVEFALNELEQDE